jgi:hypothetical protein
LDTNEVAIEYFKALRAEIDLRIKNQSYYTISKIVACAALLGHLVEHGITAAIFTVPLLAVLLDFIILHNLGIINKIGLYLRDEIESKAFSDLVANKWLLYETKVAQRKKSRSTDLLDRFGQLGITIVFFLAAGFLHLQEKPLSGIPIGFATIILILLIIDIILSFVVRASGQ